jgi:hypothetical protein
MKIRELEFKASRYHHFFGAAFVFVVLCWLAISWSTDAAFKPPVMLVAPLLLGGAAVIFVFCALGLIQCTQRVKLSINIDGVRITESTLLGSRQISVKFAERPTVVYNRPCHAGAPQWSILISYPIRFRFGKGLSKESLDEIYEALCEAMPSSS